MLFSLVLIQILTDKS